MPAPSNNQLTGFYHLAEVGADAVTTIEYACMLGGTVVQSQAFAITEEIGTATATEIIYPSKTIENVNGDFDGIRVRITTSTQTLITVRTFPLGQTITDPGGNNVEVQNLRQSFPSGDDGFVQYAAQGLNANTASFEHRVTLRKSATTVATQTFAGGKFQIETPGLDSHVLTSNIVFENDNDGSHEGVNNLGLESRDNSGLGTYRFAAGSNNDQYDIGPFQYDDGFTITMQQMTLYWTTP